MATQPFAPPSLNAPSSAQQTVSVTSTSGPPSSKVPRALVVNVGQVYPDGSGNSIVESLRDPAVRGLRRHYEVPFLLFPTLQWSQAGSYFVTGQRVG